MRRSDTFWLFTHNFTNTGAPLVLAGVARELASKGLKSNIKFVSWGGKHDTRHSTLHNQLIKEGFSCKILEVDDTLPCPRPGDRVLLNSLAIPQKVAISAQDWLKNRRIKRLDWFIHEARPEVWLPEPSHQNQLRLLLEENNFHIRVPSLWALDIYQQWLGYFGAD